MPHHPSAYLRSFGALFACLLLSQPASLYAQPQPQHRTVARPSVAVQAFAQRGNELWVAYTDGALALFDHTNGTPITDSHVAAFSGGILDIRANERFVYILRSGGQIVVFDTLRPLAAGGSFRQECVYQIQNADKDLHPTTALFVNDDGTVFAWRADFSIGKLSRMPGLREALPRYSIWYNTRVQWEALSRRFVEPFYANLYGTPLSTPVSHFFDPRGRLHLGFAFGRYHGGGLVRIDIETGNFELHLLPQHNIHGFARLPEGRLLASGYQLTDTLHAYSMWALELQDRTEPLAGSRLEPWPSYYEGFPAPERRNFGMRLIKLPRFPATPPEAFGWALGPMQYSNYYRSVVLYTNTGFWALPFTGGLPDFARAERLYAPPPSMPYAVPWHAPAAPPSIKQLHVLPNGSFLFLTQRGRLGHYHPSNNTLTWYE